MISVNKYDENAKRHGVWLDFNNGKRLRLRTFKHGILNGYFERYSRLNGQLEVRGNYINGNRDGLWETFYSENGQINERGFYEMNGQIGFWENYWPDGSIYYFAIKYQHERLSKLPWDYTDKDIIVIRDKHKRLIKILDVDTGEVYLKVTYNGNGKITYYYDYRGNWYSSKIFKFICPYNPKKLISTWYSGKIIYRKNLDEF